MHLTAQTIFILQTTISTVFATLPILQSPMKIDTNLKYNQMSDYKSVIHHKDMNGFKTLKGGESKDDENEKVGEWSTFTNLKFPSYSIRVKESVKLCDPTTKQITGYLDYKDKHFFFWFFESKSKPESDPLVLWLNGGPGCSSLTGLFAEHGPCRINPHGNGTLPFEYSWNKNASMIYLDQPLNVGFSYSNGTIPANSDNAAKDVLAFLQLFLSKYPKYSELPFHVTGESFAGHYIPAIANTIVDFNHQLKKRDILHLTYVNLVSIAIGNGLTDPLTQYKYYADYAADPTYGPIFSRKTIKKMRDDFTICKPLIEKCYAEKTAEGCIPGTAYCNNALVAPIINSGLNMYDIRQRCNDVNGMCVSEMDSIVHYLNQPHVQSDLGVDMKFSACQFNITMNFMMDGDWLRPYVEYIPALLNSNVKVLIYAGDADYVCNFMGNKAWTMALDWTGGEEFRKVDDLLWRSVITGRLAGEYRATSKLAFLRVYGAGHMVPADQPEHSLEFFNSWIHGTNLV
ncbi:hypothetical protein HDV02_004688 [Globomyces sp. JEL0801]|nr:hypothetical protein HDV02_004688 [Globomyces sp. JEL0801]